MRSITATLIFCWMSVALAKVVVPMEHSSESNSALTIQLSMMEQSVDDMYSGCTDVMAARVKGEYFPREMRDPSFHKAWKKAVPCRDRAMKRRPQSDKALTDDHLQAICMYTANDVYEQFNGKVQSGARLYGTGAFKYHALHFWLTYAIRILATNNQTCHTTVRRSKDDFTGQANQVVRFGRFASTSYNGNLLDFGRKTCFYIRTCLGVYLKEYSVYNNEEEVLIPPYEMFQISKITEYPNNRLKNCDKVIELRSVGVYSKLNCKAAYKEE